MTTSDRKERQFDASDRLEQVESRLAFLEHSIDAIAGEVEAQQSEMRRLSKLLQGLEDQLDSLRRETGADPSQDEPPPHY